MTKAFDVQDLLERLKAKGLDAAEDIAKIVASEVIDWSAESLALHENVYIKLFAPIVAGAKGPVLEQLDKIDKKVG